MVTGYWVSGGGSVKKRKWRVYPDSVYPEKQGTVGRDLKGRPIVWLSSGQELKFKTMRQARAIARSISIFAGDEP